MKVLLFGASGQIGSAIAGELLARGHQVTGVTRGGHIDGITHPDLVARAGDVRDAGTVAALAPGHDAVASAVGPRHGRDDDRDILIGATGGLIDGLRKTDVRRLVVLGGAGSLRVAPGTILLDTPHFPEMWRANATAQKDALALYRAAEDLDWTFVSPPAEIQPGERTGTFRVGGDDLLKDEEGRSRISIADYAAAFVDEIEQPTALRRRISVAY
ncbi:hypothetical protein CcI49_35270 [Frankia sp. CcI49]|uniref:NAD(P)-dependent oxidoreductase n=1 Tax=unclassified Frankia TaxID=2632575 RepID=UPI0006CA1A2B|nr:MULTISPECIES: NAD(P)H-binding protein [unclassified Frankia]KPM52159.1 hypothetical protein ACG83_32205 [Frankia sp. R43]ONH51668.1 hypothetical protein CcI49_35270 [Frankia sp. CcI49]